MNTQLFGTIKAFTQRYSNSFIYCTIAGLILYAVPAIQISAPDSTTIIQQAEVARSNAESINSIPENVWQKVRLPHAIPEVGRRQGGVEWIRFEIDDSNVKSNFVGVLIENLPHGGKIYLDNKLEDIWPSTNESHQILNTGINSGTVYLRYEKDALKTHHTVSIRSHVAFSHNLISEIFVGDYSTIRRYRGKIVFWNSTILFGAQALCLSIAAILLALLSSDWRNKSLRGFLSLAVLWPLWLGWSQLQSVPYEWWAHWRASLWFGSIGVLCSVTSVTYILLKEKMPTAMKWYYVFTFLLAIIASFFNDQLLPLAKALVSIELFGLSYVMTYILVISLKRKDFKLFSMFLFILVSSFATIHDSLYWTGTLSKIAPDLIAIGVPRYFLQSHTLTHLIVLPTISLIAYEAIKAIRRSFEIHYELKAAAQRERNIITRDLHDSLGATLTMANIQSLNGTLTIDYAKETILSALNELRLILNGFNESSPNLAGIVETVVEQAKKGLGAKRNIEISYSLPYSGDEPTISQFAGMNLVKIIREAITNSVKYSKCTEINIDLHYLGSEIMIEISDNGTGFDVASINLESRAHGLRNMYFRADEVGGRLVIESIPGNTVVSLFIPIETNSLST